MRISVDRRDRAYVPPHQCVGVKIILNGAEFVRAVTADEEEGIVVAFCVAEDGQTLIKNWAGDAAKLETLHGEVKIVLPDNWEKRAEPKALVEREADGSLAVLVYSQKSPSQLTRALIDVTEQRLIGDRLPAVVLAKAAAAAERLCGRFKDTFDPLDMGKRATEAYARLLESEAKAKTRH